MRFILLLILISSLFGCAQFEISSAINRYTEVRDKVHIGDSKQTVLSILSPTQENLNPEYSKRSEIFQSGSDLIEVYFFRSEFYEDGLTTDDEFTPYIFKNGSLVAIGWTAIGGTKSQAMPVPQYNTTIQNINGANPSQQILNHGAGGCTPNFSTGGCL